MKVTLMPASEAQQIAALFQSDARKPDMITEADDILLLARRICNVSVSAITILSYCRTSTDTSFTGDANKIIREIISRAHPGEPQDSVIIIDSADDEHLPARNVMADAGAVFYADIPIITGNGILAGYLSVLDTKSNNLSAEQLEALRTLVRQASGILKLRLKLMQLEEVETASKNIEIATQKLDEQKKFYENILNKLPTDIAVFDAQHKYIFVNPGAIKNEELRKYIIGKDDFEYARYRNRDDTIARKRREQFLEIKNSAKEIRWEDSLQDPDGNTITHLRRLFPVFDENGELNMVIGFGIDITDRKLLELKQTALFEQLSAQNIQLVDFCNIVSHNLRAPLVNMTMLVKFIQESTDPVEQKQLVSKLNPVLENLHSTFNELVESIQIKQDIEIESERLLFADYLKRTTDGLEIEINKSGAQIETDFKAAPEVHFPSKYLLSILHNLISNALKYQSPDRPPHIKIKTEKANDSILLSVEDNGLGIDLKKHKDSIFKIGKVFHRHPNAKGFGLFMTKTQVEAMGGTIRLESTPGAGSTFYVEFKKQRES